MATRPRSETRHRRRRRVPRQRSLRLEQLEQRTLLASISGGVWNDQNLNLTWDSGESGLSNWRVYLDTNGNGTWDASEPSALTATGGTYTLGGLATGSYSVREVVQSGWKQTWPGGTSQTQTITLTTTTPSGTAYFGNAQGTVYGYVWADANLNQLKDTGESALSGWTVYLDKNGNGTLDTGESSVVTDTYGYYAFGSQAMGTYTVREVLPFGWKQTWPGGASQAQTVTLTTSSPWGEADFGNAQGTVYGYVWADANLNQSKDTGESALSGWTVYLDKNGNGTLDTGEASVVTDTYGYYAFGSQAMGTYTVREVLLSGWKQTWPGGTSQAQTVTLTTSSPWDEADFGNAQGTVYGYLWADANLNQSKDTGESALSGWTIYLDKNGNGTLDSGESSVVTDTFGYYAFGSQAMGTYTVREVLPSGWKQTWPGGTSQAQTVTLTTSSPWGEADFGNAQGTVYGYVWADTNLNQLKDTGELALSGWTVYLDKNGNGTLDTGESSVVTDAYGYYALGSLAVGTYTVREVLPSGWKQTWPGGASQAQTVTLTSSSLWGEADFGNAQGTVYGYLWADANLNQSKDTGESALSGWTIYLDKNGNGTLDTGESSVVTDTYGYYAFGSQAMGTYTVREVLPSGWQQTWPGGASQAQTVTLTSSGLWGAADFGNVMNVPPVLRDVAASAMIPELAEYAFTASASDSDIPAQTLTFSLADFDASNTVPSGATIGSSTGVFRWTPTEAQGPGSYKFNVSVSDGASSTTQPIVLTVTEVNSAPTDLTLSPTGVAENQPAGTVAGTFATIDPDAADVFVTALVAGAGGTDNAGFRIVGSQLLTEDSFDYEAKSLYEIRVRTTDQGGLFVEKAFTIAIADVNDAPQVSQAISDQTAGANRTFRFVLAPGTFADDDAGQSLSYAATTSDGAALPWWLSFDVQTLTFSGRPLAGDAGQLQVRVTATDSGSPALAARAEFTITVTSTAFAWQNAELPADVDGNGSVAPLDVLNLINWINSNRSGPVPGPAPDPAVPPVLFLDPSGDDVVSPIDVLEVINYLNSRQLAAAPPGEGETPAGAVPAGIAIGRLDRNVAVHDSSVRRTVVKIGRIPAIGKVASPNAIRDDHVPAGWNIGREKLRSRGGLQGGKWAALEPEFGNDARER